jgi:putative flavoprotein involved in K+ transport
MSRQGQTIVIGGGQAGLAVGYYLAKRGVPFQILDANPRIGDAWRNRWDSLRLFTTARYAGLPGLPFPARGHAFPTKEEMADYLEFYAEHFHLPMQTGVKVEKLSKQGEHFVIEAGTKRFAADQVVVAMANYQVPKRPAFATDLHPSIIQLHSHDYRNPSQLQEGGVLIVGAGNSGADIGIEVARSHATWISGKESGVIPFPIDGVMGRFVLSRVVRFLFHHVFTVNTPIGRKLRPKMLSRPAPLVRVKPKDLIKAGIKRLPRVIGARGGLPLLQDGYTLNVRNVIWCTGYHLGFSWIDLPIFDEDERLMHECGIVTSMPGMYFVGLHFLYAMSSATVMGVGRDAERIAGIVERHTRIGKTEDKERSGVAAVA